MDKFEYKSRLYVGIAMFVVTAIIGFMIYTTDCTESQTEDGVMFCGVLKDTALIIMAGFLIASGLGVVFTVIVGYVNDINENDERLGAMK